MKKSVLIIAMGIFGTAAFAQDATPVQNKKLRNPRKFVVVDPEVESKEVATQSVKTDATFTEPESRRSPLKLKIVAHPAEQKAIPEKVVEKK